MNWMISANGNIYDHASAFQRWGFIDWRQKAKYKVGDIVYIYCTRPYMRVMYKTIVEKESMSSEDIVNDKEYWYKSEEYEKALSEKYMRLKLKIQVDSENLTLPYLIEHGLKAAPQGPTRISDELADYIDKNMDDYAGKNIFPESDMPSNYYEGAAYQVTVNKYERSSIARQKCIEFNGNKCFICGFDFEKTYGEVGKNFIHIHHLRPLNEIGEEYIVNYKKDLIPVCPNCHAMLHRKVDGKYYTWQELKELLKANSFK